jgi:hypothetical protein
MKVLILAGSLFQTVPEAPIDSSQQQRFFHMSLERDLKKAGTYLSPDSPWRRDFMVGGHNPFDAQRKSELYANLPGVFVLLCVFTLFISVDSLYPSGYRPLVSPWPAFPGLFGSLVGLFLSLDKLKKYQDGDFYLNELWMPPHGT